MSDTPGDEPQPSEFQRPPAPAADQPREEWQPRWQAQWEVTPAPGSPYPPPPPPPPQQMYGAPPYGYVAPGPAHPQATTALVLGIVGLASVAVVCGLGLVVSPFAWAMGRKAVREIDASGGAYSGRGAANAGFVMGVIGTVLLVLALALIVLLVAVGLSGGFDDPVTYEETNAHLSISSVVG